LRHDVLVELIIPRAEVTIAEVARVKRGWRSDWRGALEEPAAFWEGDVLAEALGLIDQLPESELMRCFSPGFGMRLHDESTARLEILFCFHCHIALMIDLVAPGRGQVGATFDPDSDPARELLSRFRRCAPGVGERDQS